MASRMSCRLAAALALVSVPTLAQEVQLDESCAVAGQCDEEAALLQKSLSAGGIGTMGQDIEFGAEATLLEDGEAPMCDVPMSIYPYIQPKLWGTAYNGWEMCSGKQQSPINIRDKWCHRGQASGRLDTDYGLPTAPITVANSGHNFDIGGDFGTLTVSDITFRTAGFHFHTPSETTVNFRKADMEMHIVNMEDLGPDAVSNGTGTHLVENVPAASGQRIAVVGILFDIGKENECLNEVFALPAPQAGCEKAISPIDIGKCFEKQLSGPWWSFMGSLTTPPCTEGLFWNVMKYRATISKRQLKNFQTRYLMNARPTQPLHGRTVTLNKGAGGPLSGTGQSGAVS